MVEALTSEEIYALKLRLIFHDLPTKPADILRHEERAKKAFENFVKEITIPKVDEKLVRECDRLAAASDRLAFSKLREVLKKVGREIYGIEPGEPIVEHVVLISPTTPSQEMYQQFYEHLGERFDEDFTNNLIRIAKGRTIFEAYLAVLRGLEPIWCKVFQQHLGNSSVLDALALPADTRLPHHTVFDHLRASAAIATALHTFGDLIGLVRAEVPNVQAFISEGLKLRDLWARSWLVSAATIYALTKLFDEESGYSPDSVIMPYLLDNAFIDAWLKGKHCIEVGDVERIVQEIAESVIPGAFTLIAKPDDYEVAKRVAEYFDEAFRKVFETVKKWLKSEVELSGDFWEKIWDSNVWSPLKLSVTGKAYGKSEFEDYTRLINEVGDLLVSVKEAERGVLSRQDLWQALGEYPKLKFSGSSYNERLALTLEEDKDPRASFSKVLSKKYQEIDPTERLDPLTLTTRLLAREGLFKEVVKELFGVDNIKPKLSFLSTPDAASMEFRLTLLSLLRLKDTICLKNAQKMTENIKQLCEKFFELTKNIGVTETEELLRSRKALISLPDFNKLVKDEWLSKTDGLEPIVKLWVSFVDGEWFYPETWIRNVERWKLEEKPNQEVYNKIRKLAEEAVKNLEELYKSVKENCEGLSEETVKNNLGIDMIKLISEPKPYYAMVRADADDLGKEILSGNILITHKDAFRKLIDVGKVPIADRIDIKVKELLRPNKELEEFLSEKLKATPAYHSMVSRSLASIAQKVVELIKKYHGLPVYVGGDDLLAILPPETALEFVAEARELFSKVWLTTRDGATIAGLGPRASQSFSVLYTHYITPLTLVVKQSAKLLEAYSKETYLNFYDSTFSTFKEFRKNTVTVAKLTRSGELDFSLVPFGIKGKEEGIIEFLIHLQKLVENDNIPRSLLKELLIVLEELERSGVEAKAVVMVIKRIVERRLSTQSEEFYKALEIPNKDRDECLYLLALSFVKHPQRGRNSLIFNIIKAADIIKGVIRG